MLTDKDEVTIAELKWDDIEYKIQFVYGRYHVITNEPTFIGKEINLSNHETLDEVYAVIEWFNDCVKARLKAMCEHFFSEKGQKEFMMSRAIKSPTQTITVAEVEDVDGTSYTIKMVPDGWELITSGTAEYSKGRYMHTGGVFNNLRSKCSEAAYKALIAQYNQLKGRFDFVPNVVVWDGDRKESYD